MSDDVETGIIIDKVLAKSSQPATVKNSAQDVETSHDQDPGKKVVSRTIEQYVFR